MSPVFPATRTPLRTATRVLALGLTVGLGLASAPAALRAQVALDMQLSGGVGFPTGFLRDAASLGPAAQVAVSGSIPYTPLAVRGSLLGVQLPGRGEDVKRTSIAAFGADFVYKFAVAGVRPYVMLGPAFYLGRFSRRTQTGPTDPLVDLGTSTFFRGGFSVGAGVQAGTGRVRGFAETSYHALRLENAQAVIVRPQFVAVTAGIQVELRKGRITHHW